MIKVYQTIIDQGNGNCQQAVIASLFDTELETIPHFLENLNKDLKNPDGFDYSYLNHSQMYLRRLGYEAIHMRTDNHTVDELREIAKFDGGINGYFYASVASQTFTGKNTTHAVVIDTDLNIVHDPNPNQLALKLKPEQIYYFYIVNDWYRNRDNGDFIKGDKYIEPMF